MNEGRIGGPSIAETYYDIAATKAEKPRGEELSEEDIRDTDRAMSLLEESGIDWDKFDIELSNIRELSPEDAKQKLDEVISALILSGQVDKKDVNVMQRLRNLWKENRFPVAAAAAIIFMAAGCQPRETQVDAGSGPATIEQADQERLNENYSEFVNQDIVNQWVKEHTNLKGIEIIGVDVHEDKTEDGFSYSADVKVKVIFPDGREEIKYGSAVREVEHVDPAQRERKYGMVWETDEDTDSPSDRLNAMGDQEYVKSQIVYNALTTIVIPYSIKSL